MEFFSWTSKKTFDTVDHVILLTKLRYYGVETEAINWFTSYLANRQQVCYAFYRLHSMLC